MFKPDVLYGVEVILHFEILPTEEKVNGLIQPKSIPEWIEGTVIGVGTDCKKNLEHGDKVIVSRENYQASPILPKKDFDFVPMPPGTFKVMTEYLILMKVKGTHDFTKNIEISEPLDPMVAFAKLDEKFGRNTEK